MPVLRRFGLGEGLQVPIGPMTTTTTTTPDHAPSARWAPLTEHMRSFHGLTITKVEAKLIAHIAEQCSLSECGGVPWLLSNALRHLSREQLNDLGEAIANRSGSVYLRCDPT
jgi:hypothetical protein